MHRGLTWLKKRPVALVKKCHACMSRKSMEGGTKDKVHLTPKYRVEGYWRLKKKWAGGPPPLLLSSQGV